MHIIDQLTFWEIEQAPPSENITRQIRNEFNSILKISPENLRFTGQIQRILDSLKGTMSLGEIKESCLRAQMDLMVDLQSRIDNGDMAMECKACLYRNIIKVNSFKAHSVNLAKDLINQYLGGKAVVRGTGVNYPINQSILTIPDLVTTYIEVLRYPRTRDAILGLWKGTLPTEDRDILRATSRQINTYINRCSECEVWTKIGRSLKDDLDNWFRRGGWLEIYTGLMLEKAGCSMFLYNTKIDIDGFRLNDEEKELVKSKEIALTFEADILALYSSKLLLFECKDRGQSSDIRADFYDEINKKAYQASLLGANSLILITLVTDEKSVVEYYEKQNLGINLKILFLNRTEPDDLDVKLWRLLNGID